MAERPISPPRSLGARTIQRIDVFLQREDNHIRGSQVIARAAAFLRPRLGAGAVLTGARFERTTANRVLCLRDEMPPPEGLSLIGAADFALGEGDDRAVTRLRFAELAEPADCGESRDAVAYEAFGAASRPFCGSFAFAGLASFEDLLTLMVRTVETVHQDAIPGIQGIWLAGFRRTALPLDGPAMTAGTLSIKHQRLTGSAPRFRSVSTVDLEGAGGVGLAATITLGFQAPAVPMAAPLASA